MAHRTLMGNAMITGSAVQLTSSSGGYVNLPGGLVSGASATTIESWVTFGANGSWARLFDFGNISGVNGANYLFFTPHTSVTTSRISVSTTAATQDFDIGGVLDNQTVHLVCIYDPTNGYSAVYANGVKQSELSHTLPQSISICSAWSFLGRSLFSADSWLNASIDEFRIYDDRLTPQEITANLSAGPNVLPSLTPSLVLTNLSGNSVPITDPSTRLRVSAALFNSGTQSTPAVTWSQISRPGTVTFANASAVDTTALFSGNGAYTLQCAAVTSSNTYSTQLNVMVNPPADSALALWLKLNEDVNATTAADSSGNGNTGTVSGGLTWQPAGGVVAGTMLLNGSNGYIDVPDSNSLDVSNAFTLAFWVRANSLNTVGLVSKRNSNTSNNAFTTYFTSNGRLNVDIDTNNNRFASNTVFSTGKWYHVALVFDGSLAAAQRATLYVNGVLDKVATESSATIANYSSSLKLGLRHTGDTRWFNGNLDDVRLYRRALNPAEISAIASAGFTSFVSPGSAPATLDGVAANLIGRATNELSGTFATSWSKVSGTGTATFSNAATPTTQVTFSQAGTYVLRLTATNSAGEIFNDLSINVSPNPNVYSDWIGSTYPGIVNQSIVGAQADPNNDGLSNLLEWALGLDPTKNDAIPWSSGHNGLPIQSWLNTGGNDYLCLQVRRPIGRIGITYSAQATDDLTKTTWDAAVQVGAPTANGDGSETVIFQDPVRRNQSIHRFMRLKVTQP